MPHASDPNVIPIMRGRLVLVAERYGTPRVLVTSAIRSLGYPAKACPTGADALAFLRLHPEGVQCLLAEVGLPDVDGRELAARALALVPSLKVVVMVGPDDTSGQGPVSAFRGLPCVNKPVFRDRLAPLLEELLGPPAADPRERPSMGQPRSRRRPSGSHPA
jgi:CheY-like chemotaxis protein